MRGLVVPEIVDSISTRHPTYICGYGVMVATLVLGTSAKAWGFESLYPYHGRLAQLVERGTLNP
jgi:hypothetical protein